jgi:hypothetical protein
MFTKIQNITGGNPQNPGPGNTATGESGIAFDTTNNTIKVFDGTSLYEFQSGIAPTEVLAATNTLTAEDTGKTLFLNHATEFATTLPAPAAGLEFTFIVTAAPASASYTVVTASSAQIIFGHVLTSGFNDSPADVETSGGATTITFVDGVASVGDRCHVISDGTNWYASALCAVEAGVTFTG